MAGLCRDASLGKIGRKKEMIFFTKIESPLGLILLTSDGAALTGLYFLGQKHEPKLNAEWRPDPASKLFHDARFQLLEYFSGHRRIFDIPFHLMGTPFQTRTWKAIQEIPFGATLSYRELAGRVEKIAAVRAVGAAGGRNPVSIVVPCHRVIGLDGSLTGYAGGLERKKALLELETMLRPSSWWSLSS